jgi:hypothetical protein
MTFKEFWRLVVQQGWTLAQLRCDVRPTEDLLALMDELGLDRYERYVLRAERMAESVRSVE